MAPARSLHEIFAGLAGAAGADRDVAAVLRASGHPELPADLLAQAVVSYADTAAAEVAEHLAPFVMAHGPVIDHDLPATAADSPFDLLATVPAAVDEASDPPVEEIELSVGTAGGLDAAHFLDDETDAATDPVSPADGLDGAELDPTSSRDLAFGVGDGDVVDRHDPSLPESAPVEAEPMGYDEPHDPSELPDGPLLPTDPWSVPSLADDAADAADIDDFG
ncbi:hypothetical protein ACN27F_02390 [Solwaraspora sp. WMMB335]|uniref:hypothetical protein n=1 Tax=Solwaraspora sp. WMMB335 TaxID=3404118 RepID=UPI003B94C672